MSKTAKKKTSKTSSGIAPRRSPVERRRADQRQQAVREVVARASANSLTPDPDIFIYSRWERFWMGVRAFFGAQP